LADPVEQPLAVPEEHRGDVERQLVDDPGRERLAHGRGAARDVDAAIAGGRRGLLEGHVEAVGDEVERRAALQLDRVVGVVGHDEDGGVVGRLVAPPAAPVLVPRAADRAEHVAAHDVGAARAHQPALGGEIRLVVDLAEMPRVELHAADAQRVVAALAGAGDEAVERDGHVTRGDGHGHPA
jgi:hypothetical protein